MPMFPPRSALPAPLQESGSGLGLFAGANDPIARLRMAGLFGGGGKPTHTSKDELNALRRQAEAFRAPIPPVYRGTRAWLPAFGNPFVEQLMLGQERARTAENERISREASQAASGATTLEDLAKALVGGSPEQAATGLQLRAQEMVRRETERLAREKEERERRRRLQEIDAVYGPAPASQPGGTSSAGPQPLVPNPIPGPGTAGGDWSYAT